jgi:hypothetical protein
MLCQPLNFIGKSPASVKYSTDPHAISLDNDEPRCHLSPFLVASRRVTIGTYYKASPRTSDSRQKKIISGRRVAIRLQHDS